MNKVMLCGDAQFCRDLSDAFFTQIDVKCSCYNVSSPILPNISFAIYSLGKAEVLVIDHEHLNEEIFLLMGIARANNILIVGVGTEDYYTKEEHTKPERIAYDYCEINVVHEDLISEICDYI